MKFTQGELREAFQVDTHSEVPNYDVVRVRLKRTLRSRNWQDASRGRVSSQPEHHLYYANILGRNLEMDLKRNQALFTRNLSVTRKTSGGRSTTIPRKLRNCHYVGVNGTMVAAFSECDSDGGISGVILLPEEVLQVKPLPSRLRHLVPDLPTHRGLELDPESDDLPHLLYTAWQQNFLDNRVAHGFLEREAAVTWGDQRSRHPNHVTFNRTPPYRRFSNRRTRRPLRYTHPDRRQRAGRRTTTYPNKRGFPVVNFLPPTLSDEAIPRRPSTKPKFLELAVFVDSAAYSKFIDFLGSEAKLTDFVMGYINQVQAIYLQPSLQERVHISIVHLELQETQPDDLPHYDGNRDQLLSSFCKYQSKRNPGDDTDPRHWDVALYLSGLNFFAIEEGRKNVVTMGTSVS